MFTGKELYLSLGIYIVTESIFKIIGSGTDEPMRKFNFVILVEITNDPDPVSLCIFAKLTTCKKILLKIYSQVKLFDY